MNYIIASQRSFMHHRVPAGCSTELEYPISRAVKLQELLGLGFRVYGLGFWVLGLGLP